jgi:hypothetical protein
VPLAVAIDPDGLILAARTLAGHNPTGRPRNALLRRAVSSAYYALFHEILRQTVDHLLPGAPVQARHALTRSFTHAQLETACGWIAQRDSREPPKKVRPLVDALRTSSLVVVADVFCDLQSARNAADYNHLHDQIAKVTVDTSIAEAESAIQSLRASPNGERNTLAALLAVCCLGKSAGGQQDPSA